MSLTIESKVIEQVWIVDDDPSMRDTYSEIVEELDIKPVARDVDPKAVVTGIERCLREFAGIFEPARKSWRALIRIENIDVVDDGPGLVDIVVPGWNPNKVLQLSYPTLPPEVFEGVEAGQRLYARTNLGAENEDELFFCDWESK